MRKLRKMLLPVAAVLALAVLTVLNVKVEFKGSNDANATVSTEAASRVVYDGDGNDTTFEITFPYGDDTDTVIVVHVDSGAVETTWTENGTGDDGYTVSAAGTYGTVVANTAPASGEKLVIYRDTPQLQPIDLKPNRRFPANAEEAAFDRVTLMIQELAETFTRALRLPITADTSIDTELPDPVGDRMLGWNTAGTAIENKASAGTLTTTSWSEALLAKTNSNDAKTYLSIPITAADVAAVIALGGTYLDGEGVSTIDNGNRYRWDDTNSKWFVAPGNIYTVATYPTTTDFTIPTGTWIYNSTAGEFAYWSGASFSNYRASTTAYGAAQYATSAENTTGTSDALAVAPATQGAHLSAAKAWVNFDPDGTINSDYNVSTITDTGTGDWTINFDTALTDANYTVVGTAQHTTIALIQQDGTKSTSACRVTCRNSNTGGLIDPGEVNVIVMGN